MAPLNSTVAIKAMLRLLVASILCVAVIGPAAWADDAANPETAQQRIEAAYLYKFGGYVTWPDKVFAVPDTPVVIGVAGADGLAGELETLVAGRNIGGRPVVVRRIRNEDQLAGVHILFIGSRGDQTGLFESSRGQPILVVTEGKSGLGQGAAMSFVVVDDRVRFDVSLDAVQESGLKLSASLLSVAHAVSGAKP